MSNAEDFHLLDSPEKGLLDKKIYRAIQLKNGLVALLISDPQNISSTNVSSVETSSSDGSETDNENLEDDADVSMNSEEDEEEEDKSKYLAAASLSIGVGSFEDLNEIEGLMHFLEHMVFMGSEKYPKENFFDNFIKRHGGSDNAHTDLERTTFYFDIQENVFEKGLDIFAQFFISPLMKKEAMQRERKAVHSEFQESLNDDDCRRQQLLASIAQEGHPMSLFSFGNEETLQVKVSDQELHKKLHNLRSKFYSGQHMTLCIQAREPLDKLQDLVTDIFSKIHNNGESRPTYEKFGLPFDMKSYAKLYKVVPSSDTDAIDITWSLPSLLKEYESKPLHYISHLIGHEGNGSILSYFKKKVWAIEIDAGNDESGSEHNTTVALLHIRVRLTSAGFNHIQDVLCVIFQYLDILRREGPVEWIFREIQRMEELDFMFAEELSPMDNVENISECMQLYPSKHFLSGSNLLQKYDPKLIKQCLELLQPTSCNIMVTSKHYEDVCVKSERWFGTKYISQDIPVEWMELWRTAQCPPELHMPQPNPFIPDNFDLKKSVSNERFPIKIDSSPKGELWFKQDTHFKLPRAHCYFYFYLDHMRNGPQMGAMLDLYLNLFMQQTMETLYPANMAQFATSIYASDWGIVVKVTGFNQKIGNCVDLIITEMSKFSSLLEEEHFEEMKKQQLMAYHNAILSPDTLRRDLRLSVLQEVHWQVAEKMKSLQDMTMEDFVSSFVNKLNSQRFVRSLIQGNITSEEAKAIHEKVVETITDPICPEMRVRKLEKGDMKIRAQGLNPASANTSVVNYYQGEQGCLMSEVLNEFIIMAMDEPVFDTLRTKEQLGYHVYCTNRNTFGVLGISITVNSQADKFSVDHIEEKMESFLTEFSETVRVISDDELSLLKKTLQDQKMTVDVTLKEEVDRNWGEVVSGEYLFDRFEKQVDFIGKIERDDASSYLKQLACESSRRKLSVQVIGSKNLSNKIVPTYQDVLKRESLITLMNPTEEEIGSKNSSQFVLNLKSFAAKLPLYPVTKILKHLRYLK